MPTDARRIRCPFWLAAIIVVAAGWGAAWGAVRLFWYPWHQLTGPVLSRWGNATSTPWLQNLIAYCRMLNLDVPIWATGFLGGLLLAVIARRHRLTLGVFFVLAVAVPQIVQRIIGWYEVYGTAIPLPVWVFIKTEVFLFLAPALGVYLGTRLWPLRRDNTGCHRCGYGLTQNESGVCPECGTSVGAGAPGAVDTSVLREGA